MASDNELLIKLGVETSSASKQIQEITKELKQMEKQVKAVDNASDGFNSGLSGIAKKVDIYTNKIDALNTKLKVYEKTLEEAEYQMKTAKSSLDELGKRTSDNAKDWDTATKKLEIAQNKYNNTVRSIQTTRLELQNTSNEIRKLNDSFEDLKFDSFSKEIDGLETDLKLLDKQIGSIDTTTDNFGKNMSGMGEQTELYRRKIDVLNESIDKHKKELESIKTSVSNVESWLDSLGERTEENAEEWDRASDYLIKYKDRQGDLENSLVEVQSELRETTNDLTSLNKEMAQMPFEHLASGFDKLSGGLDKISQITQPLTAGVIAIGTGAITTAMSFEEAMAKVQAVSGATGDDFDRLSQKARQIGGDTQLSASEGAEALLLLAQAGYDTETSLGMVDAVVDLAIANQMDLAEATEIVTASISSFNLEAKDAVGVTDVLSTVASSSNSNVSDLGEAFKAVAPTASALGFSVEDTAIVLGLMANQAIQGSEAGNGLKSVLANLVKPTKDGSEALKELGVELTNSDGTMRDLTDIVADLQKGFSGLSEEEQATIASTIAGKQQMSKFLAIVNSGEDGLNNLSKAVENSNGKTNEMRMIMEDTASGGLKELQSKLEETFIIIGNELLPVFNDLVDALGDALVWFQNLDEGTQEAIIKFALFSATISPITGALSKVTGGLSSFTSFLGKISGKVAGATTGVSALTGGFNTLGTTVSATGSGSLLAGLGALGTALAPWLVGGAIAFGVGATVVGLVEGYNNLQKQIEESANDYDYGTDLMMDANERLAQDVAEKYKAIEEDMYNFRSNGIETLLNSFDELEEGAEADFSGFLTTCETKMGDAKIAVQENSQEMSKALEFLNTDITTVFSESDLATIQDGWSRQMTKGMEVAYSSLETTINEKDGIIEGLMIDHGYNYEQAYSEWEGRVLEQYQDFCDQLIIAQTGYQEESLGSLDQFLADQEFKNRGDYNQYLEFLRGTYDQQAGIIAEGYAECTIAIQRGEDVINGIHFDSAEQAQKYADLTFQYKMKQLDLEQERKIQVATETAYQLGTIDEETYNNNMEASKKREQLYTDEFNALSMIVEQGGENVSGSWDEVWSAIMEAEETGISKSLTQNKDFVEALGVYFDSGGQNMEEAIRFAFDAIIGKTDKSVEELDKEFGKLDTQTQAKFNNIMNKMTNTGATLEEVCEGSGVDVQTMIDYIHYLATQTDADLDDVDNSIDDTKESINGLKNESKTDTGVVAKEFGNMGTRVMSALTNMDGSLVDSSKTTDTETGKMINATAGVSKNFGNMGTRVMSALVDTQGNLIRTAKVASTESSSMQRSIDSVKGKSVDVTVNFKAINYEATVAKMQQAQTHVYSAAIPSYKDALIPTINFGENYMEDLYGLKDAGIKTISLANLEDGISAYATKDSTASERVTESVYNHNANTTFVSKIPKNNNAELIRALKEVADSQNNTGDVYVNIEVKNGNPQEIIKVLENYLKPRSKKW